MIDKQHTRIVALVETAEFAASIFREIEASKCLGMDSLAGKAIEAGSNLLAAAKLIRDTDPKFVEASVKVRVLRALELDESAWTAGAMHAYGALCYVTVPMETIPDALAYAEKRNPINGFNSQTYKATYTPEGFQKEPMAATPWTGFLYGLLGHREEFQLRFFVKTAVGDIVQFRLPCKSYAPIRRSYRVVNFKGGRRVENTQATGWRTYFRVQHRMWSSPEHPSSFVFTA